MHKHLCMFGHLCLIDSTEVVMSHHCSLFLCWEGKNNGGSVHWMVTMSLWTLCSPSNSIWSLTVTFVMSFVDRTDHIFDIISWWRSVYGGNKVTLSQLWILIHHPLIEETLVLYCVSIPSSHTCQWSFWVGLRSKSSGWAGHVFR